MLLSQICHDYPGSFEPRMPTRPKHRVYLETILDKIVYGGALLDDAGRPIGSIPIIDVADQAAADSFVDAD
jgi:uncharacterized protein YciI